MVPPTFQSAVFRFMPAYGWHEQRTEERLAPQIKLARPMDEKLNAGIHTIAIARNGFRNCLWTAAWHPAPVPDLFYEFVRHEHGTTLVCFHQPSLGVGQPFRLLTSSVDVDFPRVNSTGLWRVIDELTKALPSLIAR